MPTIKSTANGSVHLAVDNALAGYTDCMVSQWLTEFTLVPLRLVSEGQKSIPIKGIFWKQVVSSTGQPLSPVERLERSTDNAPPLQPADVARARSKARSRSTRSV